MNYQAIYDRLIERARNRVLEGYVEKHHVIPRCMGGTDDLKNIVALTPEEHYLAHLLLVRIYKGVHSLVVAAVLMTGYKSGYRVNNKSYGWVRKQYSEQCRERRTGYVFSEETRAKIAKSNTGKRHSTETKKKQSLAKLGKPSPNKGKTFSEEHRRKLSEAKKGIKQSPETIEKRFAKIRARKLEREQNYGG